MVWATSPAGLAARVAPGSVPSNTVTVGDGPAGMPLTCHGQDAARAGGRPPAELTFR